MKIANRFRGRRLKVAALSVVAFFPSAVASAQCEYTIAHTLPNGPTCGGQPYVPQIQAIADDGSVCGYVTGSLFCPQLPFVWHPGDAALTILSLPPGMVMARAMDLNTAECVVGFSRTADDTAYPCRWVNGVPSLLPMPPGFGSGFAEAVSSLSIIAGYVGNGAVHHAITWTDGSPEDLHFSVPRRYSSSSAFGIGGSNRIVGNVATGQIDGTRAAVWDAGVFTVLPAIAGGTISEAVAANNSGDVVGFGYLSLPAQPGFAIRSFVWRSGTMTDLGVFVGYRDSHVSGVNALGRVVGWCETELGASRSFVWQDRVLSTVLVTGVPLARRLTGINDAGQLVQGRTIYSPVPRPPYDIDQNCTVNIDDLLEVINSWGLKGSPADCTQDGIVNVQDLVLVLVNWD